MNQHEINTAIEAMIKKKDHTQEPYTQDDLSFINQYTGSGGQGKHGAKGEGVLYEFYTPLYICEIMWKLAHHYGSDGGAVLEPSVATGNLFVQAPQGAVLVGLETNPVTARICKLNNQERGKIMVYNLYFEQVFLQPGRYASLLKDKLTWLPDYPFSLVIGNPPYGKHKNYYSGYFKENLPQIEQFFMYKGLQLLKPGGLLVYLTSSNFMRNGLTYNKAKELIGQIAEFVDAYRLPAVFQYSEVPTDILIFKRK